MLQSSTPSDAGWILLELNNKGTAQKWGLIGNPKLKLWSALMRTEPRIDLVILRVCEFHPPTLTIYWYGVDMNNGFGIEYTPWYLSKLIIRPDSFKILKSIEVYTRSMKWSLLVVVYIFTNPFARAGCDTRFGLVWFYGISTIVGYLMPNPFLYKQTVLFQTIQFSIQSNVKTVNFKQFNLVWLHSLILFDPKIGPF